MPTFRERLVGFARRNAERVIGRLRPFTAPPPPPAPRAPAARPIPPAARPTARGGRPPAGPAAPPPGTGRAPIFPPTLPPNVEAARVGEELSRYVQATNEAYRALVQMGYEDMARAILGTPEGVPVVPVPPPGRPREVPPVAPPPAVPPGPPTPPEEPPSEPPPPAPPEGPPSEERYLLNGPGIFVPYIKGDIALVYQTLARLWQVASIGSKRDDAGRPTEPFPPFAPDAVARGGALDEGKRIPSSAFRSEDTFVKWAKDNGFDAGLSIHVDGIIAPPGVKMLTPRSPEDRKREWWTPGESRKRTEE